MDTPASRETSLIVGRTHGPQKRHDEQFEQNRQRKPHIIAHSICEWSAAPRYWIPSCATRGAIGILNETETGKVVADLKSPPKLQGLPSFWMQGHEERLLVHGVRSVIRRHRIINQVTGEQR